MGPGCGVRPHEVGGGGSVEHLTASGSLPEGDGVLGEEQLRTAQHLLWDVCRVAAGICKPYDWGRTRGREREGSGWIEKEQACGKTGKKG